MNSITDSPLGIGYGILGSFCSATDAQKLVSAVWSAGTHTFRTFPVFPRLHVSAEERGTGKTTFMDIVVTMGNEPLVIGHNTQGSVHTWLDEHPDTTLGLDEIDKVFGTTGRRLSQNATLISVLNNGNSKRGKVMMVRGGKSVLVPTYSPIAMAGIGRLPDDLGSRAIVIALQKAIPELQYIPEVYEDDLRLSADLTREWLLTSKSQDALKSAPAFADGITGEPRYIQIMSPLAAIADLAGVGDEFRTALVELRTGINAKPVRSRAELAYDDLGEVWPGDQAILPADDAIALLNAHSSHRWEGMSQTRIGQMMLASLLGELGIETTTSNGTRGYRVEDFKGE